MFDARIINIYLQGMSTIFDSLGIDFERKGVYQQSTPYHYHIYLCSEIMGNVNGEILIEMNEDSVSFLMQAMQLPSGTTEEAMKLSALKEFGNMVMGRAIMLYQLSNILISFKKIISYDELIIFESLKKITSLCVEMSLDKKYSIKVHFILGEEFERSEMLRKINQFGNKSLYESFSTV